MTKAGIIKLHFGLLVLLLLNFFLFTITGYSMEAFLVFGLKIIMYLAAIALFFLNRKNYRLLKYYTAIYVFSPVFVFISYLLDGMMGAITGSFFLLFLYPPQNVGVFQQYEIKTEFSGFLSPCCAYGLYENKFLLLEKKVKTFVGDFPPTSLVDFRITNTKQTVILFRTEAATIDTLVVYLP